MTTSIGENPTRVRHLVVGLSVLMAVLLYLDRYALTPITSTILRDLKLDEEQFGRAVGAFFLAYALCQVPAGWLSDLFGARWTLALYVVGWSLATIGLGMAGGLVAIMMMRIVLGVTQAGAYPAAASLLKRWTAAGSRARANTIVAMGGRAGNLLAQFLTPMLALAATTAVGWTAGGWRIVLAGYGALGIVWAAAFVWLYRDSPAGHPRCNDAERELIDGRCRVGSAHHESPAKLVGTAHPAQFIIALLTSPELWLISLMGIAVNVGWVFLVTWLPRYLIAQHGPAIEAYGGNAEVFTGTLTAVAGFGGMVGSIVGGAAADHFLLRYGRKWGRRLPGLIAGFLVCGMYLLAMRLTNLWLVVGLMIAISFTIDFGLGASWASYQDIGGKNVAMVLGIGNMFGNFGAAYFGWYIGALAKSGDWNAVFLRAAIAMAIYASGWLLFDATRPVMREQQEQ